MGEQYQVIDKHARMLSIGSERISRKVSITKELMTDQSLKKEESEKDSERVGKGQGMGICVGRERSLI